MGTSSRNSYIFTRILIILVIVTPFILKSFDRRLEHYPAIILPAGSGTAKSPNNGYIFYQKQEIFALTYGDKKIKIQRSDLFTDIPIMFQRRIISKRFNLNGRRKIRLQKDKQRKYILEKLETTPATKNEKIKALIIRNCNYRKNVKKKSDKQLLKCSKEHYLGLTSDL